MRESSVFDCSVIQFPKLATSNGNISVVENQENIPFDVKRVYYLYDVPGGEMRGSHAHKGLQQLIVAASGSFSIELDDGANKRVVHLNRPYYGLLMVPGIWRTLLEFSSGSICLVLASELYTEDDYIRDYTDFVDYKNVR